MKTLIRLFPYMRKYVPENDKHWSCFLMLWDICTSITAFDIKCQDASNLAWTVEVFF